MGCPPQLLAQSGAITGQVLSDNRPERPIADAHIEVRSRGLATRSDSAGRFRLNGVPPGAHVVVVRALGFDSLVANLRVAQDEVLDLDFLPTRSAQSLAPVKAKADGGLG